VTFTVGAPKIDPTTRCAIALPIPRPNPSLTVCPKVGAEGTIGDVLMGGGLATGTRGDGFVELERDGGPLGIVYLEKRNCFIHFLEVVKA
jgi:hypothetical protein